MRKKISKWLIKLSNIFYRYENNTIFDKENKIIDLSQLSYTDLITIKFNDCDVINIVYSLRRKSIYDNFNNFGVGSVDFVSSCNLKYLEQRLLDSAALSGIDVQLLSKVINSAIKDSVEKTAIEFDKLNKEIESYKHNTQ